MARNRIVGHRQLHARDLQNHPLNPRNHPKEQREAVQGLLEGIGVSRSLLAYVAEADRHYGEEAPLTLIDGHLRKEELGDQVVTVEVLDVSDEEARELLLALDKTVGMADVDDAKLLSLLEAISVSQKEAHDEEKPERKKLVSFFATMKEHYEPVAKKERKPEDIGTPLEMPDKRFIIILHCTSEEHQTQLLERFIQEGLECRPQTI